VVSEEIAEAVLRLAAATLSGMVVGLNRDLHDKPMGMRTLGLVSLGSALATLATTNFGMLGFHADAISRTIQGILTGVGFIGAGAVLRDRQRQTVQGLTTAATVWIAATLGIACGLGAWLIAIAGGGIAIILLILGGPLERLIEFLRPHRRGGRDGAGPPYASDHMTK
jgi:putative Mg2+ transporter-C (MgtC) family protein